MIPGRRAGFHLVMAGLDPADKQRPQIVMPAQKREARLFALDVAGILVLVLNVDQGVDGRDKPGHDARGKRS
jgi:hypothetical protein